MNKAAIIIIDTPYCKDVRSLSSWGEVKAIIDEKRAVFQAAGLDVIYALDFDDPTTALNEAFARDIQGTVVRESFELAVFLTQAHYDAIEVVGVSCIEDIETIVNLCVSALPDAEIQVDEAYWGHPKQTLEQFLQNEDYHLRLI